MCTCSKVVQTCKLDKICTLYIIQDRLKTYIRSYLVLKFTKYVRQISDSDVIAKVDDSTCIDQLLLIVITEFNAQQTDQITHTHTHTHQVMA